MCEKNNLEQARDQVEIEDVELEEGAEQSPGGTATGKENDLERERLERENAVLKQQLLRLKADFENFRRRSKIQLENIVMEANERLLFDLLPILDNFERALNSQANDECGQDPFREGMEMVQAGLLDALGRHGLEVIKAEGEPFDPCYHDAVSMYGGGGDSLQVIEEIQTGYLLNGKILRHAKVLVGQNEEEEECQK